MNPSPEQTSPLIRSIMASLTKKRKGQAIPDSPQDNDDSDMPSQDAEPRHEVDIMLDMRACAARIEDEEVKACMDKLIDEISATKGVDEDEMESLEEINDSEGDNSDHLGAPSKELDEPPAE